MREMFFIPVFLPYICINKTNEARRPYKCKNERPGAHYISHENADDNQYHVFIDQLRWVGRDCFVERVAAVT